MLEGLKTIDWAKLDHAYGDASSVPGDLRDLTSDSKRVRELALSNLRVSVYHQGAGYSAIPATIPFLVELVSEPTIQNKAGILAFINLLSEAYRWIEWGLRETLDLPDRIWIDQVFPPSEQKIFADAYEAVYRDVSPFRRLLDDEDHRVRSEAALILAFHRESTEETLPLVRDQLKLEKKVVTRGCLLFCLGFLIGHTGREENLALLRENLDDKRRVIRLLAAAGLCAAGQPVDITMQHVLWDALVSNDSAELPFRTENPDNFALELLRSLHFAGRIDARDLFLDAFVELTKALHGQRTEEDPGLHYMWEETLGSLFFSGFPKEPKREWSPPPPRDAKWSELDSFQRRFLCSLVRNVSPNIAQGMMYQSLEYPLEDSRLPRFADLCSFEELPSYTFRESILEEPLLVTIDGQAHWKPLKDWWTQKNLKADAFFTALTEQLSFCEIHDAIERLLAIEERDERPWFRALIAALNSNDAHLVQLKDRARTLIKRGFLQTTPAKMRKRTHLFFAWALVHGYHSRGLEPPPLAEGILVGPNGLFEFAEFTDVSDEVREILKMLPVDRRARAIERWFRVRSFAEPDEAWVLYDLCPSDKMTKKLLRLMKSDPEFFCDRAAHRVMEVLAAQGPDGREVLLKALRARTRKDRHIVAAAIAMNPGKSALTPWLKDRDPRVRKLAEWRETGNPPLSRGILLKVGIDARRAPITDRPKGGVIGANGKPWDGVSWRLT